MHGRLDFNLIAGMWLRCLELVSLIDSVDLQGLHWFHLLRPSNERVVGESYAIQWFYEGAEVVDFSDQGGFEIAGKKGDWEVKVKFTTPEVRKDIRNLTRSIQKGSIA